jgi:hypothetical protein
MSAIRHVRKLLAGSGRPPRIDNPAMVCPVSFWVKVRHLRTAHRPSAAQPAAYLEAGRPLASGRDPARTRASIAA